MFGAFVTRGPPLSAQTAALWAVQVVGVGTEPVGEVPGEAWSSGWLAAACSTPSSSTRCSTKHANMSLMSAGGSN